MTGPIFLNVRQARVFFRDAGFVYTLRRRRGTGPTYARWGSRFKSKSLGPVTVTQIADLSQASEDPAVILEVYVPQSGFKTVAEWRAAADPKADHLYPVERRVT